MELTPKVAFQSALYFILTVILLLIMDLGLDWFLKNVLFRLMSWFNHLSFFWKVVLFVLGGGTLLFSFLNLVSKITTLLGGLIFNKFPRNMFNIIAPAILAIANASFFIYTIWSAQEHFNFWIVLELILVSIFIWSLSAIVIPAKAQIERAEGQSTYE